MDGRESIYNYIKGNIDIETGRLKDGAGNLPDDEKIFKPGELRWVAGGMDGGFGHHGSGGNDLKKGKKIANLLRSISKKGSTKSKIELYNILVEDSLIDCIDTALEMAIKSGLSIEPFLHDFAQFLTTKSPDRGPVKFGIALLGLIRDPQDLDVIKTLGKHEEFTLYSAVAITSSLENPDIELFKLAQSVDGWGRSNWSKDSHKQAIHQSRHG